MKTGKLKRSFTPQDSISKKGYFIIAVCSFLLVFLVWLLLTELGLVNEKFLPKPIETLQTGIRLFTENGFVQDIGVTTYRVLLGFLIFFLARIFSRKSVGMGDVKLAAVLGWYLGGSLIWFDIVVSLSLAALYSIVQLILKKLNMKDSIPLAPFFSVGTILILLLGF